jgi:hypothetical protein
MYAVRIQILEPRGIQSFNGTNGCWFAMLHWKGLKKLDLIEHRKNVEHVM